MNRSAKLYEEKREAEIIGVLAREEARVSRMIEAEEKRRGEIEKRLQNEIRRLEALKKA